MRMQTAAQSADPTEKTSRHLWLIKIRNPQRMTLGETGIRFFGGYAGSRQLGISFKASQPMTLDPPGFGGDPVPANGGLEEDQDAL
jgi:hypothetical protein